MSFRSQQHMQFRPTRHPNLQPQHAWMESVLTGGSSRESLV